MSEAGTSIQGLHTEVSNTDEKFNHLEENLSKGI